MGSSPLRIPLIALAVGLLPAALSADEPPVAVVGAYSNIVVTGTQAQGYRIELWRQGYQYFGLMISAAGSSGEGPTGVMDRLRYDPDSKSLSFTAKLSVDRTTVNGEIWVPSRDQYQFNGTLFPDQVTGTLIHTDALVTDRPARQEEVQLYRSKNAEEAMSHPKTYEEWWAGVQQILATRGPKW